MFNETQIFIRTINCPLFISMQFAESQFQNLSTPGRMIGLNFYIRSLHRHPFIECLDLNSVS